MKTPLTLLLLFSFSLVHSQEIPPFGGAVAGALGQQAAYTGHWSVQSNPAGLAHLTSSAIALSAEMPFSLKALTRSSFLYAHPLKNTGIVVHLQQSGTEGFGYWNVNTALGRRLTDNLDVGVQLTYHHLQVGELVQRFNGLQYHIGLQYQVEAIRLGSYLQNVHPHPFGADVFSSTQPTFGLGFHWEVAADFQLLLTSQFKPTFPVDYTVGFIKKIQGALQLLGSVSTTNQAVRMGIHLELHSYRIIITHQWQQWLGHTPSISLEYVW